MPYIQQLTNLKELNLEDNFIERLPKDMSQILPNLENLNINGNAIEEESVSVFVFIFY